MPARKQWDEEDSDSSTPPSSPPVTAARRRQFDDEEDDSDVLESWDAAEDSEVEREKERKAAEAKAKVAAEAAANKKSKAQRIAEHQAGRARQRAEDDEESEDDETEAERRERLRRTEQEADLRHAEDLFGGVGISSGRKAPTIGAAIIVDEQDPTKTVNLASLPLFNPQTKKQFELLRTTLAPIVNGNTKKAHYGLFLEEFAKDLAKELSSDQVKKVASALTRLSNEKMKEEKASDKTGKKTKAAKTKTSLVTNRANATDVSTYDEDAFGDDDFM
ncbi:eukaryotic translation initiation factor 3 subunit EifCj [Pochonia chlamydosporia 170]|uniref:Eukaryotic translation initiation factor 3 subunit J n=1 Tax=Pochonia chlamydosporia 170 TaxID=1380566 RepID=A0A179FFQ6_METCM|nr:eukaryotic translation initiation factor 3 subunit EifCj [Pochonia chlamydosporia 170]OAQ64178.1 eukaryotic translation initiation factor 3 subunit EifCj [Pochonia chlamydosporia 170]